MKRLLLSVLAILLFNTIVFSQDFLLTGEIKNSVTGETINNAKIFVKDTKIKAYSDNFGYYFLVVPEEGTTLEITANGFKTKEVIITDLDKKAEELNIPLDPKAEGGLYEMSMDELLNLDIEVSSSDAQPIFKTPSSVTIIDKQTIVNYNFQSIPEALQTVAGFSVMRTYLKRNIPTSRGILQDHYANKVLVLINGIPAWNAVTGEGSLERIDINTVERIEVLKGPASVQYGTNAYSGVVNIVLKETEGNTFFASSGNNQMFRAGGAVGFKKNNFSFFIAAGGKSESGKMKSFTDELDNTANLNDYVNYKNLTTVIKYKSHSLTYNGFNSEESFLGVAPRFSSGAGNPHFANGNLVNYTFRKDFADKLTANFELTYDNQERDLSRSITDTIRAHIKGYNASSNLFVNYKFSERFNFELGGDFAYRFSDEYRNYNILNDELITGNFAGQVIDGNNNMNDKSLTEYSGFSNLNYNSDRISARVGARYTYNEFFKQNLSMRGVFVFSFNDRNSLKLIYGESFRAPSFFEYNFVYSTVLGNPNLKPETSRSFELAYLTGSDKFFMQALAYYGIYDNKIYRALGDTLFEGTLVEGINIYQNGSEFTATGGEIELNYNNPKVINMFLNYNILIGDNGDEIEENDHYNFKYVPQHSVSLGISKSIKNFRLSALANFITESGTIDESIGTQYFVDLNLNYTHDVKKLNFVHSISCKNLLDSDYYIPEYVRRRTLDRIPMGFERNINYTLKVFF